MKRKPSFCKTIKTSKTTRSTPDSDHLDLHQICEILKHRSCWLHIAATLYAHQGNVSHKELLDMEEKYGQSSPCFIALCKIPRHMRSRRRSTHDNPISIQDKALDSGMFEQHLDNIWRSFPEDRRTSFTFLGSLWFSLYRKEHFRVRVLDWIKSKHIFSKKYVFVPIVCWGHWRLLVFCHFGEDVQSNIRTRCMLLLDSLHSAEPRTIEPDVRKFVWDIFREAGRPELKNAISRIPLLVPKAPQQKNAVDCGRFVLCFINLFMEAAPENFSISRSNGYPYFMKPNWFSPEDVDKFCSQLEQQMCRQAHLEKLPRMVSEVSTEGDDVILLDCD